MLFIWKARLRASVKATDAELGAIMGAHEKEYRADAAPGVGWKGKARRLATLDDMIKRGVDVATVSPEENVALQKTIVDCVSYLALCGAVSDDKNHGIYTFIWPEPGEMATPLRYTPVVADVPATAASAAAPAAAPAAATGTSPTPPAPLRRTGTVLVLHYGGLALESSITKAKYKELVASQKKMLDGMSTAQKDLGLIGCVSTLDEMESKAQGAAPPSSQETAVAVAYGCFAALQATDRLPSAKKTCHIVEITFSPRGKPPKSHII